MSFRLALARALRPLHRRRRRSSVEPADFVIAPERLEDRRLFTGDGAAAPAGPFSELDALLSQPAMGPHPYGLPDGYTLAPDEVGAELARESALGEERFWELVAWLNSRLDLPPDALFLAPAAADESDPAAAPASFDLAYAGGDPAGGESFAFSTMGTEGGSSAGPPHVVSASFDHADGQHPVRVVFDENVSASLAASDLTVFNTTTNTAVPASAMSVAYDAGTNTATWKFPGLPNGRLPNGVYTATVNAAGVSDADNNPLDGDGDGVGGDGYTFSFFFQLGDANRDGRVDVVDLGILSNNYGRTETAT